MDARLLYRFSKALPVNILIRAKKLDGVWGISFKLNSSRKRCCWQLIYSYLLSRRYILFISQHISFIFISKNTLQRRHLDSLLRSLFFWCRCAWRCRCFWTKTYFQCRADHEFVCICRQRTHPRNEMKPAWAALMRVIFSPKNKNKHHEMKKIGVRRFSKRFKKI